VKKLITKIACALFILLWLMPLLAVISFDIKKNIIQTRMREKLGMENLQTIKIAEKDVIWMDKHEIWVNEHMFDIHSKELQDGFYIFTGLYDEDETELVLDQHKNSEKNQEQSQLLSQLFKCLHSVFYQTAGTDAYSLSNRTKYASLTPCKTLQLYRAVPIQPPRKAASC
jgi:hypothetical protein